MAGTVDLMRRCRGAGITTVTGRGERWRCGGQTEVAKDCVNGLGLGAEGEQEGLVGGWVRLTHHTGGNRDFKLLYMFEDRDHMDDFFRVVQTPMAEEHPDAALRCPG